ncbi:hypothetical protein JQ617_08180 [Bradyrhizobium sp. KB893862 SZCCT0404]|nr:hypothetical protein [Bradyrhizobium sp. KB893862 SZCCT0404]MBR1173927.1 hypothetical protein [Bradyrhizobium sp. KB893862 SZCCT0404]
MKQQYVVKTLQTPTGTIYAVERVERMALCESSEVAETIKAALEAKKT